MLSGLILIPILSTWVIAFIGNLFIYHEATLLPSLDVLFIKNKNGLHLVLLTIAFIYFAIFFNTIIPNSNNDRKRWKRLRTQDERHRYSKKFSEKQLIKELNLECIKYDTSGKTIPENPKGGVMVASHKDKMYILRDYIHSIFVGTTKTGKTESLLLPQLQLILDSGENAMVIDPKGALYTEYSWKFRQNGYKVYRINFTDPLLSDFRNPFESGTRAYIENQKKYNDELAEWKMLRTQAIRNSVPLENFYKENPEPILNNSKAIEFWTDVAILLTFDKNAGQNASWNDHARDMIVGGACLLAELGKFDAINITSIRQIFAEPKKLQEYMKARIDKKSDSFSLLSAFINSPDTTRDSMISVFNGKTQILSLNKEIRMMTSFTNVEFTDLGTKKCIIFFNCHDEKSTYFPLMSLYVDQIYQDLVALSRERLNKEGIEKLNYPINFIFEEFGIMHPLKNIKEMIGACRSRGIRLYFYVQDFLQLYDTYGKEIAGNIIAQCQHIVYLLSGDEATKKDISNKAGTRQVWDKDHQAYKDVPVISVDELNALRMGEFVSIFQRIKGCCQHQFAYFKEARYYKPKPESEAEQEYTRKKLVDVPIFVMSDYINEEMKELRNYGRNSQSPRKHY